MNKARVFLFYGLRTCTAKKFGSVGLSVKNKKKISKDFVLDNIEGKKGLRVGKTGDNG